MAAGGRVAQNPSEPRRGKIKPAVIAACIKQFMKLYSVSVRKERFSTREFGFRFFNSSGEGTANTFSAREPILCRKKR